MTTLQLLLWTAATGVLTGLGLIGAGVSRKRRALSATGLLMALVACLAFLGVGWLILSRAAR